MPDGTQVCLGDGMKGLTVRTVELVPSPHSQTRMATFANDVLGLADIPENTLERRRISLEMEAERRRQYRATANRRLSLASVDVNNSVLTAPRRRTIMTVKRLLEGSPDGLGLGFGDGDFRPANTQQGHRPAAAGGNAEMDRLQATDRTGGLQWHFVNSRESDRYPFPVDRAGQVRAVAWDSPKYCYVVREALQAAQKYERLLIYTNNPLTSQ